MDPQKAHFFHGTTKKIESQVWGGSGMEPLESSHETATG